MRIRQYRVRDGAHQASMTASGDDGANREDDRQPTQAIG